MPVVERKNTQTRELVVPADEVVSALGITIPADSEIQLLIDTADSSLIVIVRGPGR